MNDEWWMTNDEWWTMNDWASHELRMMNDESRIINDEWCLSSSKCWTEKSHPFISKVSQKLDYCLSTHIRLPSQPRCLTGSTESVYFTKGKTEFQSNLRKSIRSIYSEGSTKVRLLLLHTHTSPISASLCTRKHWIGLRLTTVYFRYQIVIQFPSIYCLRIHVRLYVRPWDHPFACWSVRHYAQSECQMSCYGEWRWQNDEWRMMNGERRHRSHKPFCMPFHGSFPCRSLPFLRFSRRSLS